MSGHQVDLVRILGELAPADQLRLARACRAISAIVGEAGPTVGPLALAVVATAEQTARQELEQRAADAAQRRTN